MEKVLFQLEGAGAALAGAERLSDGGGLGGGV